MFKNKNIVISSKGTIVGVDRWKITWRGISCYINVTTTVNNDIISCILHWTSNICWIKQWGPIWGKFKTNNIILITPSICSIISINCRKITWSRKPCYIYITKIIYTYRACPICWRSRIIITGFPMLRNCWIIFYCNAIGIIIAVT